MDYVRPIESIVPGVQGKVLTVLAGTETELTMSTVSRLAGTGVNRTVSVLNHLVALGLVERRDVGASALVRLVRENEAVRSILELSRLRGAVLARIGSEAATIDPAPLSVVVFGSMARGEAGPESDIDVVVVRSTDVDADDAGWTESLGRWSDKARLIAGSPVNLLVVAEQDVAKLLRRRDSVWQEIVRDGVTLVGRNLPEIGAFAR